jgi:hypothetical protein
VANTDVGHLDAHPAAPTMPSGTLKPTAKGTVTAPLPAASMEAASRRTSPGAPGDVPGPLNVARIVTTSSTAQVDEVVSPGSDATKSRCACLE